jgi:uncharacterized protein YbjT (DUF2867 family)
VILTGATGLVGSAVLAQLLSSTSITRVSILSRKPVAAAKDHAKANVILQSDFSRYPSSVLDQLQGAEGCVWAQGATSVGQTEKDYTELTHDWPLEAAKAFASTKDPSDKRFNFVYVSGEGADQTEKARAMFGRIKGRAEKDLLDLANDAHLSVYNLRPAGIDGSASASNPSSRLLRHSTTRLSTRSPKWLWILLLATESPSSWMQVLRLMAGP